MNMRRLVVKYEIYYTYIFIIVLIKTLPIILNLS